MTNYALGNQFNLNMIRKQPNAVALISGNSNYPRLNGLARFYRTTCNGVLVNIEVYGLPDTPEAPSHFYALHIHENGNCTIPFDKTGTHYNPANLPHPYHAGDMPPLLSNNGFAWMSFFDRRFKIEEIIGRSIIIHSNRDDFTTQPSGDAGDKIGCGVIK